MPRRGDSCRDSVTVFPFEEQRRSAALQLSVGHDGDPVAQQVGLLHEVGRQQQRATRPLPLRASTGGHRSLKVITGHRRVSTVHCRSAQITARHLKATTGYYRLPAGPPNNPRRHRPFRILPRHKLVRPPPLPFRP